MSCDRAFKALLAGEVGQHFHCSCAVCRNFRLETQPAPQKDKQQTCVTQNNTHKNQMVYVIFLIREGLGRFHLGPWKRTAYLGHFWGQKHCSNNSASPITKYEKIQERVDDSDTSQFQIQSHDKAVKSMVCTKGRDVISRSR